MSCGGRNPGEFVTLVRLSGAGVRCPRKIHQRSGAAALFLEKADQFIAQSTEIAGDGQPSYFFFLPVYAGSALWNKMQHPVRSHMFIHNFRFSENCSNMTSKTSDSYSFLPEKPR